jgi:uncharacterized protein HemX
VGKVRDTVLVILAIVVALAMAVGLWFGGWALRSANTNKQAHIDRQNYGSQLAYINKVSANMAEVSTIDTQVTNPAFTADQRSALTDQKAAIVTATCGVGRLIVDVPADESSWLSVHCN